MASPTTPSDAEARRGSGHRRRRLHRQPRRQGPGAGWAAGSSCTTTCRRATGARCAGATSSSPTCTTRPRCAGRSGTTACAPSCTSPRWPRSGDSVRDPSPVLPREPRGHARAAEGDGGRGGPVRSSSRRRRPCSASRRRRRSRRRTTPARSTRTGRPSSPSSGRSATSSRAYGLRSIALRYFNAAGADPDGEIGEDHRPEAHLIPLAIDAARGGEPRSACSATTIPTPDGTCLRDYIHVTDLAQAHVLALRHLETGRGVGHVQPRATGSRSR